MIKTRAIVLHRFPYSDSSWIVKALTEESGVVSFILKGAKKKDSPFKGALDPLALSEVVFRDNPQKAATSDGGLIFVKEATLINWRENLRSDLMSLAVAQVMAEILLKYAPQGVPLQDEFTLLNAALDELNGTHQNSAGSSVPAQGASSSFKPSPRPDVFARWLLDTSDLWGYHLDLTFCSRCERPLKEPAADFHPESGGLICKACLGVESPRAKPETLKGLWMLRNTSRLNCPAETPLPAAAGIQLCDESLPQADLSFEDCRVFVENALLAYLRNHIGFLRELKSLQFLMDIRKLK